LFGIEAKLLSAGVPTTCMAKSATNIELQLRLVGVGFGLVGTLTHMAKRHTKKAQCNVSSS